MSIWFRCAALCWIVACVPPQGAWQAQPGWQGSQPSTTTSEEYTGESRATSDDEYDDAEDSRDTGGYDPRGSVGGSPGSRGSEDVESPRGSGGSGWLCTAEASFGTARGDDPFEYTVERAYGSGTTREAAAQKAYNECHTLVYIDSTRANINGLKTDGGTCTVSQCSQTR